jgi:hypothetical protein
MQEPQPATDVPTAGQPTNREQRRSKQRRREMHYEQDMRRLKAGKQPMTKKQRRAGRRKA